MTTTARSDSTPSAVYLSPHRLLASAGAPTNVAVSVGSSDATTTDWIARPVGGWFGSQVGGTTATVLATATRVTRTAVCSRPNDHAGTVAGPRLVAIETVVRIASVTRI